ncbi:amino acid adenylation domain-containing protein [Streptomyces sp. NPDC001933]|uniref:amino acid adenylation domain-containing protein n=1 Tax=Streptomyces sp. NPDC001933 TaxID=3364626 RepID=UPI0036BB4B61
MSQDRDALFLQLLRSRGLDRPSDAPIEKSARSESRLSLAQERMWFLEQLHPEQPTYHVPLALRLSGALDAEVLRAALGDVVARHAALRSVFPSVAGRPRQVIRDDAELPWTVVDVAGLSEEDVLARAEEESRTSFDLAKGPLVRACLLRSGADDHVLVVTFHHIVFDGWSVGVFTRELSEYFAARTEGRPPVLAELPIQFGDFAEWQRDWLDGDVLRELIDHWRQTLDGAPPVLELPADRPRPAVETHRGTHELVAVPADLVSGLREVCAREDVTLFMVLLAAFDVLLARYSGQEDIVVGTPIANRNRAEIEPLIGFFVNTLVLRTDIGGDPTVSELLSRVRASAISAYANENLPFARLVEELRPERDLSRSPLVQVMFALANTPEQDPELPGLTVRPLSVEPGVAKFDLSAFLREEGDEVVGGLEYATDLFDRETVLRFWDHYLMLLRSLADAEPGARISSLVLIPAQERRLLAEGWNATERSWPGAPETLHGLFEAQAARTPDATAVVHGEAVLTYRELDEAANRLARRLPERGVGPESVVGLYCDRGPELITALLAVLKVGAAYLPLDPAQPQPRLAHMLRDSGTRLVLTQDRLAPQLPEDTATLSVDRMDDDPAPTGSPAAAAGAGSLAYVIYTSGSTGVPKGVAIEHRAVVNLIQGLCDDIGLGPGDRLLAVTTPAFDIAALELLGPLARGATVVLADRETVSDGRLLGPFITACGATVMQATPSLWRMLLDSSWAGDPKVRVLCGGEALPPELLDRLLPPVAGVHNVYGPTETTVWSLATALDRSCGGGATVPIGRPLANTRAYVVDRAMELVPLGVPGELCIGGRGVARGYVGLPALTAERFVPDPYGGDGGRLYRTGDIVRYRPDGRLEFLGRSDHQVKLRGFRIELNEIQNVLLQHPEVDSAVAVLREDRPGDARIIGYFTAPEPELRTSDLRQWLAERLPEYMVPALLVQLDALPQTANGKIDRNALPVPGEQRSGSDDAYVAPRSDQEQKLVDLFADVLDLPAQRIGIHDDFFALGGQSLLAVALISRVCSAFGVDLPLSALFTARTVAAFLPVVLAGRRVESAGADSPDEFDFFAIPRAPRDAPLPLAIAQERLWFFEKLRPGTAAYNEPLVLRLGGALDAGLLRGAVEDVVARHEALRSTFPSVGGRPRQVVDEAFALPWSVVDMPGADRQALIARAEQETRAPFDLAKGPLVRACLLRVAPQDHVLVLTIHHAVFDGWSLGILLRELAECFAARTEGRGPKLPELPVQYGDYAVWQREWLADGVLEDLADYWRETLEGAPPVLELPADHPRPAVQSHRGVHEATVLPADVTEGLRELCKREEVTMFMVLLTAFKILLARYSGQEDVVVGTPVANRNRVEIESLIGFFVNTLVLRTDLSGDPSVLDVLDRVRDTAIGAYANQDMPYAELVKELRPPRDPSRSPLVQVMFALANTPDHEPELTGLTVDQFDAEQGVARFDLSLLVKERDDVIAVALEYCTDLFEPATARRLLADYTQVIVEMLRAPDAPLSQLNGISR